MDALILCRHKPVIAPSAYPSHLAAETEALRELRNRHVLTAAHSPDGAAASSVLILSVGDIAEAEDIAYALPLAEAGLIHVEGHRPVSDSAVKFPPRKDLGPQALRMGGLVIGTPGREFEPALISHRSQARLRKTQAQCAFLSAAPRTD
jgi:hypothetical protein